jgi:hypothetical protein
VEVLHQNLRCDAVLVSLMKILLVLVLLLLLLAAGGDPHDIGR